MSEPLKQLLAEAQATVEKRVRTPAADAIRRRAGAYRRGRWYGGVTAALAVVGLGVGSLTWIAPDRHDDTADGERTQFSCLQRAFAASALQTPVSPPTAAVPGSADKALADFLASPDGPRAADVGVQPLAVADEEVLYGVHFGGGLQWAVAIRRTPTGWHVSEWGTCRPQPVRAGADVAPWSVPASPDPAAETFAVLVASHTCSATEPPRPVTLDVRETADTVVVTAYVLRESGPNLCAGVPATVSRTVVLTAPLSRRTLLDGSTTPPQAPRVAATP